MSAVEVCVLALVALTRETRNTSFRLEKLPWQLKVALRIDELTRDHATWLWYAYVFWTTIFTYAIEAWYAGNSFETVLAEVVCVKMALWLLNTRKERGAIVAASLLILSAGYLHIQRFFFMGYLRPLLEIVLLAAVHSPGAGFYIWVSARTGVAGWFDTSTKRRPPLRKQRSPFDSALRKYDQHRKRS